MSGARGPQYLKRLCVFAYLGLSARAVHQLISFVHKHHHQSSQLALLSNRAVMLCASERRVNPTAAGTPSEPALPTPSSHDLNPCPFSIKATVHYAAHNHPLYGPAGTGDIPGQHRCNNTSRQQSSRCCTSTSTSQCTANAQDRWLQQVML